MPRREGGGKRFGRRTGILEDHLLASTLENILLDGVLGDEAVDVDVALLSDTMSASHGLEIVLRVPVE
jgi:hypothetical protein